MTNLFTTFRRWRQPRTRRILTEDALKHLYDCACHHREPSAQGLAGVLNITVSRATELLTEMQTRQLITFNGTQFELTDRGRDYALHIVRAHRLWERYLADKTGYPEAEWHIQSENREHSLTPAQADALAGQLGHPRFDPHGDPIPTAQGEVIAPRHQPLSNFSSNQTGKIIHLEDEPEAVYAQLLAEGLHLGMTVSVIEATSQRIRFWADGEQHVLAPIVAANVSVAAAQAEDATPSQPVERLTDLKPGEAARVKNISQASRGAERRRLMDLGILPGTTIKAELVSPSGDPTAYLIRGALIGLRKEQARFIYITRNV